MTRQAKAYRIAREHVDWALREGMTTTDIAFSIGVREPWLSRSKCVELIKEIIDHMGLKH